MNRFLLIEGEILRRVKAQWTHRFFETVIRIPKFVCHPFEVRTRVEYSQCIGMEDGKDSRLLDGDDEIWGTFKQATKNS